MTIFKAQHDGAPEALTQHTALRLSFKRRHTLTLSSITPKSRYPGESQFPHTMNHSGDNDSLRQQAAILERTQMLVEARVAELNRQHADLAVLKARLRCEVHLLRSSEPPSSLVSRCSDDSEAILKETGRALQVNLSAFAQSPPPSVDLSSSSLMLNRRFTYEP